MSNQTNKMQFIDYTVGLMVEHKCNRRPFLAKVEYNRLPSGDVRLNLASGHSLAQIDKAGTVTISADEFEDRPVDPYDNIKEARWAFGKMGAAI